jgi:small GTP-binding protein
MRPYTCIGPDFWMVDVAPVDRTSLPENAPPSLRLQIWDTAGQERFRCLGRYFFKDAAAAALVFAIDSVSSFDEVEEWAEQIRLHCPPDCQLLLVGSKSDLAPSGRKIRRLEAIHLAKRLRCKYMECSAKTGADIDKAFAHLATKILKNWKETPLKPTPNLPVQNAPGGLFRRAYNWMMSWWDEDNDLYLT